MTTTTDLGTPGGWRLTDELTQLREWGHERRYSLPLGSTSSLILGSSETCSIQLNDPRGRISRQHARLVRRDTGWYIEDHGSKNGTWIDGTRQACHPLLPGTEIGLGGYLLIAESAGLIELRRLLQRMLGWSPAQAVHVDRALRSVRDAALVRAPLLLSGDGDLAPIARQLHNATLGVERPFVEFTGGAVASALVAAAGGTLYVTATRRNSNLGAVVEAVRDAGLNVRLTIGSPKIAHAMLSAKSLGRVTWTELPPLAERMDELPRIMIEYLRDAATELDLPRNNVRSADIDLLREQGFDGLADVEDSMRRLLVLRSCGVTRGAARLGLHHAAMIKWAERRSIRR